MKNWKAIPMVFSAVVFLFGIELTACVPSTNAKAGPGADKVGWVDEGLRILEVKRADAETGPVIRGAVLNTSPRVLSYAEVNITLIDAIGRPISTTSACTTMVEPQAIWKWEAPVYAEGVADFQVVSVVRRY
ncbi:MAG TPA: FxLYD domain-containing protein [Spirochaetia bacterium]|nr:FxLYD domain-containing protein [Spirochaetia bacterium]